MYTLFLQTQIYYFECREVLLILNWDDSRNESWEPISAMYEQSQTASYTMDIGDFPCVERRIEHVTSHNAVG